MKEGNEKGGTQLYWGMEKDGRCGTRSADYLAKLTGSAIFAEVYNDVKTADNLVQVLDSGT